MRSFRENRSLRKMGSSKTVHYVVLTGNHRNGSSDGLCLFRSGKRRGIYATVYHRQSHTRRWNGRKKYADPAPSYYQGGNFQKNHRYAYRGGKDRICEKGMSRRIRCCWKNRNIPDCKQGEIRGRRSRTYYHFLRRVRSGIQSEVRYDRKNRTTAQC